MAKTLAQGRKPGSGRKPGKGKTLREGRKPGSGRKRRDTLTSPIEGTMNTGIGTTLTTNIMLPMPIPIPIPRQHGEFTTRDMEAVDALRELTHSPQFSPNGTTTIGNSNSLTLPPIAMDMINKKQEELKSFPTFNRILSSSPIDLPIPSLRQQLGTQSSLSASIIQQQQQQQQQQHHVGNNSASPPNI